MQELKNFSPEIVKKPEFKVLAVTQEFDIETCRKEIPEFWGAFICSPHHKFICGQFGICHSLSKNGTRFRYSIANPYTEGMEVPDGLEVLTIPENTWAIFPCVGAMPNAIHKGIDFVYHEWLPKADYEKAGDIDIEEYTPGNPQDLEYKSFVWIPVKKKISIQSPEKMYPRSGDKATVYLKSVVKNPNIRVGDFTMYNDFVHNPADFEKNNVLYHYPTINHDRLTIGKYCSIACGAKFIFNSANHTQESLSTYPFPIFFEEWGLDVKDITRAWQNKGDIEVGNDVWIGYEAILLSGVKIGDGAIIGTRAVVTEDVPPYTIVGGVPAKPIRKRFPDAVIEKLLELKWWNWPPEKVKEKLSAIQSGNLEALLS